MSIVTIIIVLFICGLALWLCERYIPLADPFPLLIRIAVILFVVLWLLNGFGIINVPVKFK